MDKLPKYEEKSEYAKIRKGFTNVDFSSISTYAKTSDTSLESLRKNINSLCETIGRDETWNDTASHLLIESFEYDVHLIDSTRKIIDEKVKTAKTKLSDLNDLLVSYNKNIQNYNNLVEEYNKYISNPPTQYETVSVPTPTGAYGSGGGTGTYGGTYGSQKKETAAYQQFVVAANAKLKELEQLKAKIVKQEAEIEDSIHKIKTALGPIK